jgi:hypothetical protein
MTYARSARTMELIADKGASYKYITKTLKLGVGIMTFLMPNDVVEVMLIISIDLGLTSFGAAVRRRRTQLSLALVHSIEAKIFTFTHYINFGANLNVKC